MRVLLIEDDKLVATVEKLILQDHDITHVTTLSEAIQARLGLEIEEKVFDLIVLDLRLPFTHDKTLEPEEVIRRANYQFDKIPIIIISAELTDAILRIAVENNMICIEKSLLDKSPAFLNVFMGLVEVSRKMRSESVLTKHMTSTAIKVATENTAQLRVETSMDRTKARLYLFAGLTIIGVPWLIILYTMYCRIVLQDIRPIPYYTEILLFCGLGLASIFGILPWFLKFFGPFKNITLNSDDNPRSGRNPAPAPAPAARIKVKPDDED